MIALAVLILILIVNQSHQDAPTVPCTVASNSDLDTWRTVFYAQRSSILPHLHVQSLRNVRLRTAAHDQNLF